MAKDWITGRSWNTGGGGGSPFAMAAIGLLQALQNNRREDERKEEYERMMQEKKAMQEIEYGRSRLDKIMALDPSLIMDNDFNAFYQTGDWTGAGRYLGGKGWAPKTEAEKLSLVDQMDNQVLEWQQKDPTGKTWPVTIRNYANGKYKFFPEPELPDAPKTINADGRVKQWNGKTGQWEAIGLSEGSLNRAKPSVSRNGDGTDPDALKRTDMDAVERWLFSGSYDPMRNIFTPGWLKVMGDKKQSWEVVKKGILNRFGATPWLAKYAIQRAQGDPSSPFYTDDTVPPPPPPPGQIDKAKLDKMASDAVNKLGVQGALAQVESSKLTAEERIYIKDKIQDLAKPKVTVPNLPNVHL